MAQPADYQPPVLIAEQEKVGAGDGNRTHVVGLGRMNLGKHIRNRLNCLPKIEPPPLTRRTHLMIPPPILPPCLAAQHCLIATGRS